MQFVPLGNRVLVALLPSQQEIDGVVLPESSREEMLSGIVSAIGPEIQHVKVGETVLFGIWAGLPVRIGGVEFLTMQEGEIFGVLRA